MSDESETDNMAGVRDISASLGLERELGYAVFFAKLRLDSLNWTAQKPDQITAKCAQNHAMVRQIALGVANKPSP